MDEIEQLKGGRAVHTQANLIRLLPTESFTRKYLGTDVLAGEYGVPGDGSCFFHSLLAAYNTANYMHLSTEQQQQMVAQFRCKFKTKFSRKIYDRLNKISVVQTDLTYEDTKRAFCQPEKWANEIMIRYAAEVCGLNLIFINRKTNSIYCGVHGTDPQEQDTVLILWVDTSHFVPVMILVTFGGGYITTGVLKADDESHRKIINHLMTQYGNECW